MSDAPQRAGLDEGTSTILREIAVLQSQVASLVDVVQRQAAVIDKLRIPQGPTLTTERDKIMFAIMMLRETTNVSEICRKVKVSRSTVERKRAWKPFRDYLEQFQK